MKGFSTDEALRMIIALIKEKLEHITSDEEFTYYESVLQELEYARNTGDYSNVRIKTFKLVPVSSEIFREYNRLN